MPRYTPIDHDDNGGTTINRYNPRRSTHYYGDGCHDDHGRSDHPLAYNDIDIDDIDDTGGTPPSDDHDDICGCQPDIARNSMT